MEYASNFLWPYFVRVVYLVLPFFCTAVWGSYSAGTEVRETRDGVGLDARMFLPQHLFQDRAANKTYFIDIRSCLRSIDVNTNQVATLIGESYSSTASSRSGTRICHQLCSRLLDYYQSHFT